MEGNGKNPLDFFSIFSLVAIQIQIIISIDVEIPCERKFNTIDDGNEMKRVVGYTVGWDPFRSPLTLVFLV